MNEVHDFKETLELLGNARAGDQEALQALLARYRERLLERVRLMMGERARAQAESHDFLQGTFVEVMQGFDKADISGEGSFMRWMTAIARNNIRDSLRRRREQALDAFSASLNGSDSKPSPSSQADIRERTERLVELLERLSGKERIVVELRDFEGLDYAEIGRKLDLSPSGARMLRTRALVKLGRLMNAVGPAINAAPDSPGHRHRPR